MLRIDVLNITARNSANQPNPPLLINNISDFLFQGIGRLLAPTASSSGQLTLLLY